MTYSNEWNMKQRGFLKDNVKHYFNIEDKDDYVVVMLGRLVEYERDFYFYCLDGTIASVDKRFLMKLFIGYMHPESFTGKCGRWDYHNSYKMWEMPGETLAYISPHKTLIVYNPLAFTPILARSVEYISANDYADKHNRSRNQVNNLCREGKIEGAKKQGRQWIVPKNAPYPRDNRKDNRIIVKKDK